MWSRLWQSNLWMLFHEIYEYMEASPASPTRKGSSSAKIGLETGEVGIEPTLLGIVGTLAEKKDVFETTKDYSNPIYFPTLINGLVITGKF